jgi:hypothetical protein
VIDVQVSKAGDALTVNAGVLHPAAYKGLWGETPAVFVDEPSCTVRARIGELVGDKDIWWSGSNEKDAEEITQAVAVHGLEFLERMHAPEAMETFLEAADVRRRTYPPPIIYLAILRDELGDHVGACSVLTELRQNTSGSWQAKIDGVLERLGCS